MTTAVTAFSALAFAYLTDSVSEDLLNDVDLLIIGRYQRSGASRFLSKIRNGWRASKNFLWRCLRLRYVTADYRPLRRNTRMRAVGKFVLALSDQILATGLATLIAGVANRCPLSLFEFNIVVSLGWFSVTTHLATLILLRQYFLQNKIVRNLRFLGMVTSVVLLIYGLVITIELFDSGQDQRMCLAQDFLYGQGASFDINSLLSTIVTVLYLVTAFNGTILSSSQANQVPGGYSSWFPVVLLVLFMQIKHRKIGSDAKDRFMIARGAADEYFEKSRDDMASKKKTLSQFSLSHRSWMVLLVYFDSFLSSIANRFFDLSYGISQLYEARFANPPDLDESDNRMDFGQIVPLMLLAIPVLAAAEIYYGNYVGRQF